ncbi:cellulose biosynthesis protein BcsQ [Trinickia sp. LjRoot230]|uniref:cellulose biosynthesis protein BcsQ n=1 Tax=Trinickia sp. LjRoot230 TaxID=3342288 RepID=UPI003ECFC67A
MKKIAIISTVGGSGRTSLTGALAVLLARRRRPVVALDLDPQNLLGAYLGLDAFASTGLGTAIVKGEHAWDTQTWRNGDGVLFAPYGALTGAMRSEVDVRLTRERQWLSNALMQLDLPARGAVLIDTPRYPAPQAEQAVRCADLVLCVTPPEPGACATLVRNLDALHRASGQIVVVINRLNPVRDMQRDALAMLRAALGDTPLLAHRVHLDAAMPEAFARGNWLFDDAPHSQCSHDLQGIANWLDAWLDAQHVE